MPIRTRMCMSADGFVTTPDGRPAQLGLPEWDPAAYGFDEFQQGCDAVLMGRTTFEPALGAPSWPWPGLDVFVLGSHRPEGTPDGVVVEHDAVTLLARIVEANRGGDVHLVGGPRTIETFRRLGAVEELGLIVLPLLLGAGMRLTDAVSAGASLELAGERALPSGGVEISYRLA
jgi:dihydrofolate reductase